MSTPLILGCLWVLLGVVTAMMPIRRQVYTGSVLLLSAPVLLVWIGIAHGWLWVLPALFAVGSMLRYPLRYLWNRARGREVRLPPEMMR